MENEDVRVDGKIVHMEYGTIGDNDTIAMAFRFETEDQRFPVLIGRLFMNSVDNEKRALETMRSLGWNGSLTIESLEDLLFGSRPLIGKTASLVVEKDPKYGWQVKFINAVGGRMLKKVFGAAELRERFAAKSASPRGIQAAGIKPVTQPPATDSEGLPF